MTNDEFNHTLLDKKLTFKESEAARLVLVHNISIETAAVLTGFRDEGDIHQVENAVKLFLAANEKAHPKE